jgi:RHH-type transcriptional regulator, proline utilization regulon repressor / proline dehydrogenase / delta 1-pyrroline-5-carboxylate dehydrogenase
VGTVAEVTSRVPRPTSPGEDLERATVDLAHRISELGAGEQARAFRMSWWNERLMDWAMARPAFRTQLFRFVDVFPALQDDADVARHVHEHFGGPEAPRLLRTGKRLAARLPLGPRVEARVARGNIERMARQFIAGEDAAGAAEGLRRLWDAGSAFSVDLLGEKTVQLAEADRYAAQVHEMIDVLADRTASWPANPRLEADDLGPLPRVNVSLKVTALAPHLVPLGAEVGLAEARDRLRSILRHARERGAFVHVDMEHYEVKALTRTLIRELLSDEELADLDVGVVVQAYLRDARDDLAELIAWSVSRPRPITVRLVKGAYWDAEGVQARAQGWPVPTFERKVETDANYERCVRLLHDHHGEVRAAFASHNIRTLAYTVAYARHRGIPDDGYEIQMIYGMAEPMHAAIRGLGLRLRVYAPLGELVPGMAYLVRRLLENTSNGSFVRHRFAEGRDLRQLLQPPRLDEIPGPTVPAEREATDPDDPAGPGGYHPEPLREWRRRPLREAFGAAVKRVPSSFGRHVLAHLAGEDVRTASTIPSLDPGASDVVVALSAACDVPEVSAAVDTATRVADRWRTTPAGDRAAVLFRAAEWLRRRRDEIAAVEVFEAGKPWDQADADVCEAIDFCEYYGREILRLDGPGADRLQSPPGEANRLEYQGKGVTAVIAPWNFPLALPTGMTAAALVAGNPVILKPAEQTPRTARYLVDALLDAGAPPGVVQFLPGMGEVVGSALVAHPDVAVIAFTGSKAVGLAINQQAAVPQDGQRHVKRVVAEMGGKNALVVDADADPDQAVPAAAYSAFGFAGQKCSAASRLIVVDPVYDEVVARLVGCTRELVVGHPRRPEVQVGPVVDQDAHKRVLGWVERSAAQGRVLVHREDVPSDGFYVGPTIVEVDDPTVPVAREEVFGPLLTVLRARDLDHAIALANGSDYALTAGIFSRSPASIARAAAELRAGNVYVNRAITGAVVGRQPFGGYGLSGVGSKAGGPDHLLQFLDPRVVTENTLRQGFAPDDEARPD